MHDYWIYYNHAYRATLITRRSLTTEKAARDGWSLLWHGMANGDIDALARKDAAYEVDRELSAGGR